MSQKNATCSESAKVGEKLMVNHNVEKDDRMAEIEVADSSEVTTTSDSIEKSSEINTNDTDEDDGVFESHESAVFRNHVLLKLIGKHLDFSSLKSVRTLNSLCQEVVTPQLMNKSRILLKAATKSEDELEVIKNWKGISDLKISVRLLDKSYFGFEQEGEMITEILEKFAPKLNALELDIWPNEGMPLPSPSIRFPLISTLTIEDFCPEEEKGLDLIKLVFASAPNLDALVLGCLGRELFSLLLADDGSRNWALAPKLKSLTATNSIFPEDLPTLINFPQTWQSLDLIIRLIDLFEEDDYEVIGQLLDKNKDCLVSFHLYTEYWYPLLPATLRLPITFPKLQKLSLDIWHHECKVKFGGISGINYSQTFPALTSLSIYLSSMYYWEGWEKSEPQPPSLLWASLFPPQVFEGLKYLKVDYDGLDEEEGYSPDWASRMFPNARLEIN